VTNAGYYNKTKNCSFVRDTISQTKTREKVEYNLKRNTVREKAQDDVVYCQQRVLTEESKTKK